MLEILLAIGAGVLLGSPEKRNAVGRFVNSTLGTVFDALSKDDENVSTPDANAEPGKPK